MKHLQVQLRDVLFRRLAVELPVEGVARLVDDRVARVDLYHRLYGFVPAVMARAWFFNQRLERIYADHVLFRHRYPPCGLKPRFPYPTTAE